MLIIGKIISMDAKAPSDGAALRVLDNVVDEVLLSTDGVDLQSEAGDAWDIGNRVVLPGFIDGHTHAEVGSVALLGADCRAPANSSIADIQDSLRDALDRAEARGGWLVGQGNLFLDQKLKERRLPNRHDLDAVSKDVPIVIQAGGHASCVNSKVIEMRGLDEFRPAYSNMGDPVIERDADGHPTGILGEMDKFLDMPSPEASVLKEAMKAGISDIYLRHGVTTFMEISETRRGITALDELISSGDLQCRVALALWAPGTLPLEEALGWGADAPLASPKDRLSADAIKIFTDGGFSARTAAMLTPYFSDDGKEMAIRGEMCMTGEQIEVQLKAIIDRGMKAVVHTCGEVATRTLCDSVMAAGASGSTVRAEHAGNLLYEAEETMAMMTEAGIQPMPNPGFIHAIGGALPKYLDEAAIGSRFPFRAMLDSGFRISGSSDIHVGAHPDQANPLFMMWCSTARESFEGAEVDPQQAVTYEEALKMHTVYAAESLGMSASRGSLERGKDADFVVLSRDPRAVESPDDLLSITVDAVFLAGRKVYERPGAEPLVRVQ